MSTEVLWNGEGSLRLERLVTSGPYVIDGKRIELENNVYLVGDDDAVLVVDASHDANAIAQAVKGRIVPAIVLTHGHLDHINAAPQTSELLDALPLIHEADTMLWDRAHGESPRELSGTSHKEPGGFLADGEELTIAGLTLKVLHTPGHTPGSISLYAPDAGWVLTGDTLFPGGPGATGREFSDFPTIIESIKTTLFDLPDETAVFPGHGDGTTIGAERPSLQEWKDRGY
jgi:hydroxyacylglutathione hydrolase